MTNLKTWMLHLATNPAAERTGETLIEKPPHVEPSRPLVDEKPNGNGSHHPIRHRTPKGGAPNEISDYRSDLAHRYPGASSPAGYRNGCGCGRSATAASSGHSSRCGGSCFARLSLSRFSTSGSIFVLRRETVRAFRAGGLTGESTVATKLGIQISPTVLKLAMGSGRCRRRSVLCAHLLCAMGYISALSLWRIFWVVRSSLRGRCRVLCVPSPLL